MLESVVHRAFASSLLSLLLLVTLVWGGCISCEQYFMFGGVKSCCSPNGHCKTNPSSAQGTDRECKQIAFDHHKLADFHIDLPTVFFSKLELQAQTAKPVEYWRKVDLVQPSPPDPQILHSTFLI